MINIQEVEGNAIQCEVSWENSWHYIDSVAPMNNDALWVFCKGRHRVSGLWEHISFNASGHQIDDPLQVITSSNGAGIILERVRNGEGNIAVSLSASLNVQDISNAYNAIKLFGVEMIFVSEGSFYLGDSVSNNSLGEGNTGLPFMISTENAINVGENAGELNSNSDFKPYSNIPSDYPKGYNSFYSMKYEISQQQYADFLNTLTSNQQLNRKINKSVEALCFSNDDHIEGERNSIVEIDNKFGCDANGNQILGESNDGGNIACNFLNWAHLTSYLDWAGLRPMTELEFEKSCRGPKTPVPLELAWGNTNVINTLHASLTATAEESTIDTIPQDFGIANFGYCLPSGPLRCGFAGTDNSTRLESGSTYYGIKEMSGNLWELCINLNEEGLKFTGVHGNGELDDDGYSDIFDWDPIIGDASGFRGGGWNSGILTGFRDLAISDRFFVYLNGNLTDRGTTGGRGVISKSMFE